MYKWWEKGILREEATEGGEGGGDTSDTSETQENEESEETSEEETEESATSDDLSEDEVKQSKELFKLLKNPQTQKVVLETMAKQAGLLNAPPTTNKEEKKVVRAVTDILKENLGPEYYALFGDKLSKAMEEIVSNVREEATNSTASLKEQAAVQEVDRAFERLSRESKGESNKYKAQMTQLADKITPAEGVSTYEYLNMLYTIASGKKNAASTSKTIADKINRNRSDVSDRTRSTSNGKPNTGIPGLGQVKGLKNIVAAVVADAMKK